MENVILDVSAALAAFAEGALEDFPLVVIGSR